MLLIHGTVDGGIGELRYLRQSPGGGIAALLSEAEGLRSPAAARGIRIGHPYDPQQIGAQLCQTGIDKGPVSGADDDGSDRFHFSPLLIRHTTS